MTGSSSLKPTLQYKALSWALSPAVLAYTGITAIKQKNLRYLYQRLSIYQALPHVNRPIWCHCASVGEIKTVLPLLKNLLAQNETLIVSTNTTTGYETLLQTNLDNTAIVFLPLDYSFFSNRFLNKFSPKILLLVETELWPNILLSTIKRSIPVIIVNGRISDKTLNAPAFMKKNYRRILNHADHIFASNQLNLDRYISLGAHTKRASILSNLKFSGTSLNQQSVYDRPLKNKYLLCASTHAGEEALILRAWKNHSLSDVQLVIAIRHPKRTKEVCDETKKLGLSYILHSQATSNSPQSIYIIDTIGDLLPFMQHAELVFMGGSLIPNIGGHNILEAAQFGKCILNGPHYENFKGIIDDMLKSDSVIMIDNAEQLMNQATLLLKNKERSKQLGENAKNFLSEKSEVLEHYTTWIMNFIRSHSS